MCTSTVYCVVCSVYGKLTTHMQKPRTDAGYPVPVSSVIRRLLTKRASTYIKFIEIVILEITL